MKHSMIAEEDSTFLRQESSSAYLKAVVSHANAILSPFYTISEEELISTLDLCHYNGNLDEDYWVCLMWGSSSVGIGSY